MPPQDAPGTGSRGRAQFLVSGEPLVLRSVVDLLDADPEVDVVQVGPAPTVGPHHVTVLMAPDQAEALGTAFGRLVVVEPDELLPDVDQPGPPVDGPP